MTPAGRGAIEALGVVVGASAAWMLWIRPSPNFTWDEWTTTETGLPNTPGLKDRIEIIAASWAILEPLRTYAGPLRITSGHRTEEVHAAIGATSTSSDHVEGAPGAAADIYDWDGEMTNEDLAAWLWSNRTDLGLLDQVIVEHHTGHLHIGTRITGARGQFRQTSDGNTYSDWSI